MATTSYSLPYLARWSGGDPAHITATAERVLATAQTVLAGLGPGSTHIGEHSA